MDHIATIGKDDGKILHIGNGQYRTIVHGEQTDGAYAIIEMTVPPAAGPPPHAHTAIEELFYVARGEIEFRSEQGIYHAKEGDTVRIPRGGVVHAFKNTSAKGDAILICTVHPAGLEEMFAEVDASDPSEAIKIGEKFGNKFYPTDYLDHIG